jgi:hypothetical protein
VTALLGPLTARPLAYGTAGGGGRRAGQGHHLADLFRRDAGRSSSRGAAVQRSCKGKSSRLTAWKPSHRWRQRRTGATSMPRRRAIWAVVRPSAAASMMRARKATCWAVVCRRTRVSRPCRSSAVRVTVGGVGPRTLASSQRNRWQMTRFPTVIIPPRYVGQAVLVLSYQTPHPGSTLPVLPSPPMGVTPAPIRSATCNGP